MKNVWTNDMILFGRYLLTESRYRRNRRCRCQTFKRTTLLTILTFADFVQYRDSNSERTFAWFIRQSVTLQLVSILTGLDSTKQDNRLLYSWFKVTEYQPVKLVTSHKMILPPQRVLSGLGSFSNGSLALEFKTDPGLGRWLRLNLAENTHLLLCTKKYN